MEAEKDVNQAIAALRIQQESLSSLQQMKSSATPDIVGVPEDFQSESDKLRSARALEDYLLGEVLHGVAELLAEDDRGRATKLNVPSVLNNTQACKDPGVRTEVFERWQIAESVQEGMLARVLCYSKHGEFFREHLFATPSASEPFLLHLVSCEGKHFDAFNAIRSLGLLEKWARMWFPNRRATRVALELSTFMAALDEVAEIKQAAHSALLSKLQALEERLTATRQLPGAEAERQAAVADAMAKLHIARTRYESLKVSYPEHCP